jgi:hypothetical protein
MVSPAAARRVVWLAVGLFVCYLVGTLLALSLGVGLLGAETEHLPFRLNTLITRSLMDFIPALMVLCLFLLDAPRTRKEWWLCLGLIAAAAAVYTLATTSRGGIIRFIVPVVFVWLLTNTMTRTRMAICGLAVVTVIASLQFVTMIRVVRMYESADLQTAISEAAQRMDETDQRDSLLFSLAHLGRRIGNAEGTWFALKHASERPVRDPLSAMTVERSLVEYYTQTVVQVAAAGDYRTPGLLGGFMLLAGMPGLVLFTPLFVITVWLMWMGLATLRAWPAVLAVLGYAVLTVASEAFAALQSLLIVLVIAAMCELVLRVILRYGATPQPATPLALAPVGERV